MLIVRDKHFSAVVIQAEAATFSGLLIVTFSQSVISELQIPSEILASR